MTGQIYRLYCHRATTKGSKNCGPSCKIVKHHHKIVTRLSGIDSLMTLKSVFFSVTNVIHVYILYLFYEIQSYDCEDYC